MMVERWLDELARELEVGSNVPVDALLEAARVVAHSVERRAAPLTTYLIGMAVQNDPEKDVADVCRRVIEMARGWEDA